MFIRQFASMMSFTFPVRMRTISSRTRSPSLRSAWLGRPLMPPVPGQMAARERMRYHGFCTLKSFTRSMCDFVPTASASSVSPLSACAIWLKPASLQYETAHAAFYATDEVQPGIAMALASRPDFFTTLGLRAVAGRTYAAADDVRGGGADGPVIVISHDFWQRRLHGSPDVLGRELEVNQVVCTIVGVLRRNPDTKWKLSLEELAGGAASAAKPPQGPANTRWLGRMGPKAGDPSTSKTLQPLEPGPICGFSPPSVAEVGGAGWST